ncbi:MAG: DUF4360 domain-containing protein [Deltaproteobacteria bacterium]|nr:DUF4360 domain-containing protein [Deltaproteobacteria bacterium]
MRYLLFVVLMPLIGSAESVTMGSIRYFGSGCPKNSVAFLPGADSFSILFDQFTAETGPHVPASRRVRHCTLTIPITVEKGYRTQVESIDYRGYANLESKTFGWAYSYFLIPGETVGYAPVSGFSGPVEEDWFRRDVTKGIVSKGCTRKRQTVKLTLFIETAVIPLRHFAAGVIGLDSSNGVIEGRLISQRCR